MILWRISNYATLDGLGGLRASGRWHTRGRRIVYLSATPASALLEILVHLEIERNHVPRSYKLLEIHVPNTLLIERAEDVLTLPANWKRRPTLTRQIGHLWLRNASSALLSVPSALMPHTRNFLLNPQHKNATRITIASVSREPFDKRLLE